MRSCPDTDIDPEVFRKSSQKSSLVCLNNREVKHDVYGKRQTAKMKLLPSVFSSLYSRIKIFVFAVNSETLFYFCVTRKNRKSDVIFAVCCLP